MHDLWPAKARCRLSVEAGGRNTSTRESFALECSATTHSAPVMSGSSTTCLMICVGETLSEYGALGHVQRRRIHDRLQVSSAGRGLCCSLLSAQQSAVGRRVICANEVTHNAVLEPGAPVRNVFLKLKVASKESAVCSLYARLQVRICY